MNALAAPFMGLDPVAPDLQPVELSKKRPNIPALTLEGVWKLFGTPRQMRKALRALDAGHSCDRASLKAEFDVFAAVAGVSLEVKRYEILAIVGASGSGKSTLVRHMNALIRPDRGQVAVDGFGIESIAPSELQRLRSTQIGMVFQNTSLFPHRSVIDNVVFGLEARHVPHDVRYRIAREWLARVDLAAWAEHAPSSLSGGMQQRVGLARTFATDPETLLLDEPFSALDPLIRRSLQDQFVSLVRTYRKTAVFITHDFAEAVRIADRIGVMIDGRIVQIGSPHEIITKPATSYVAGFATPELKRVLMRAEDLVEPQPADLQRAVHSIAADTTLADVISRLQAEDINLRVLSNDGQPLGWIDRGVLLTFLGGSLLSTD